MKRAGFTMIELIFVIVILGILGAVAIPKLSAVKDDAQVANANENICVNLKGPLMSYAVRHSGSVEGAVLTDYSALDGFTALGGTNTLAVGTNMVDVNATTLDKYTVKKDGNDVYVFFVDGNDTVPYGCYVGNKAAYDVAPNLISADAARAKLADGSNYL
jgi:prepilin-type N-terminal cleavage/methylation domain-containing protein